MSGTLKQWEQQSSHHRIVASSPERTWEALVGVSLADIPLMRRFLALRALPGRLGGGRGRGLRIDVALVDVLVASGFTVLRFDAPEVLELGRIARFWRLRGDAGVPVGDAAAFRAFDAAGYAKATVVFRVAPLSGGTLLETTTRVHGTDAAARRAFARYWRVVGPASSLTRIALLQTIVRRADDRPGPRRA